MRCVSLSLVGCYVCLSCCILGTRSVGVRSPSTVLPTRASGMVCTYSVDIYRCRMRCLSGLFSLAYVRVSAWASLGIVMYIFMSVHVYMRTSLCGRCVYAVCRLYMCLWVLSACCSRCLLRANLCEKFMHVGVSVA